MVIFCDNAVVTSSEEQDRIAETPTIGEILRNEFMIPFNKSEHQLAQDIHVPVTEIQYILQGKGGIAANTLFRLAKYLGMSEGYFLNI